MGFLVKGRRLRYPTLSDGIVAWRSAHEVCVRGAGGKGFLASLHSTRTYKVQFSGHRFSVGAVGTGITPAGFSFRVERKP
jgi:hypothetical protein